MKRKKLPLKKLFIIIGVIFLLILAYIFFFKQSISSSNSKSNFKIITSRNSGITFRTPWDYASSYQYTNNDGGYVETIEYFKPTSYAYKLIITISDKSVSSEKCKVKPSVSDTSSYIEKTLASTFPLKFYQRGGKGWLESNAYYYIEEKKACIHIYKNEADREIEHYFDQIIETAEYDLPWWKRI
jgi:hypothetical protein